MKYKNEAITEIKFKVLSYIDNNINIPQLKSFDIDTELIEPGYCKLIYNLKFDSELIISNDIGVDVYMDAFSTKYKIDNDNIDNIVNTIISHINIENILQETSKETPKEIPKEITLEMIYNLLNKKKQKKKIKYK